jgi:GNAT superfamily N-acetyltransferase
MSRERALALQRRGLREWVALLGSSSPGAETWERDGVIASIVPRCPQRSICNSVAYTDASALTEALDELAEDYERAGVVAWTVWAPEFDGDAIGALEEAGHRLDGSPTAMSMELSEFEPLDLGDLDWDRNVEPGTLGRLNDLAYGLAGETLLSPALAAPPELPDLRLYHARVDGEPACVLATLDHGGDLGVYFVATHPDHRGRGLASRLMSTAMVEARERGLQTTSLQASPMGRPVYARLGYNDDFTMTMYERRR